MKIKHQELTISEEKPFENCKLDREKYALALTDILESYREGFVLAINNEWGAGKTTFVKMWKRHLENQKFQTIYFNAWENDFDSNPLVAIMSELQTLINGDEDRQKTFKSALEKGAILAKNIAPALIKAASEKYLGDVGAHLLENTTKAATEIFESEINIYTNKKKTIKDFKIELEKFVKTNNDQKPLIFIVDELDRCRPDYAVEVLEQIKHFFSIPGIIFVLSIDKKHLKSSVRGFYGSEKINAEEYLRRFIDLEYSIPSPSAEGLKKFTRYLYEYYSFQTFFASEKRKQLQELQRDPEAFLSMAELLFEKSNMTLRQQEKIFALARVVIGSFAHDNYVFPHLLFILIYLKLIKNNLFKKIEQNKLELQELSDAFGKLILDLTGGKSTRINLLFVEAQLLKFYNNNQDYNRRITLVNRGINNTIITPINSKLENGNNKLVDMLQHLEGSMSHGDLELRYLMNKINLFEQISND